MTPEAGERRLFTLAQARALLPAVQRLTSQAVRTADRIVARLEAIDERHPEYASLRDELNRIVQGWAEAVQALGPDVKGLWLVDFDNGEGYYCWQHPEPALSHYHTYEDGFAGRMKIV